jgi:hypothetical protein
VPTYLLPVRGLSAEVELSLKIGTVELVDADRARHAFAAAFEGRKLPEVLKDRVDQFATDLENRVVACVEAEEREDAVELAEAALDVLRAYLDTGSQFEMASFGLRHGVLGGHVDYADLENGGLGGFRIGHFTGVGLDQDAIDGFLASPFSTVAGAAVGATDATQVQRRALVATKLASQALISQDPSIRTVHAMTAAEVLLFGRAETFKTYVLARRAIFLLCGHQGGNLCGRDRASCVVITTDPTVGNGKDELVKIRKVGNADFRWRCSEWHHVLDWYSARSQVVHEGETVGRKPAAQLVFWLTHRLLPAALEWFAAHPDDPDGAMASALAELPDPPIDQMEYKSRYTDLASRGVFSEGP